MLLSRLLAPRPSHLEIKKRPIMAGAVSFVILVCVSLIAVEGWSSWSARATHLRETQIITSNMARALAEHAENTIKAADTILVGMVERMEVDGRNPPALDRLHNFLMMRVAELPVLYGLVVYDEHGRWLAHSQKRLPSDIHSSDREHFFYHRDHPGRRPHIGPPVRSRATGDWVIPVSRRINDADGRFAGVALATIRMEHFKKFYDSFDIGHEGTIFLALDDGTLLVRRALNETTNRTNIADGPVFREYRSNGPIGTAMLTARADNVERLYSYRHLDAYPLIVATALSKDEILAGWRSDSFRLFIGISLLVSVLALLGFRLIRQISIREQLQAELREAKSALEVLNQSLETLALHDGLTGLANRRQFEAVLNAEFSRAMRNGSPLALVMLDVDYFKQYNDIYGHPAGDECLRKIGQVVKTAQNRPGDLSARYGGEELAVLLPETDMAGAMAVAEKIRLGISSLKITHSANPLGIVTVSAGVKAYVPIRDCSVPLDLVQAADQALYAAKSKGRNRSCWNVELTSA
jgi:diguanylate cyclase (GGDEF)-like protein